MKKYIFLFLLSLFISEPLFTQQVNRIQTEEQKLHYLIQTLGVCGKVGSIADAVCQFMKDYAIPISTVGGVISGLTVSNYVSAGLSKDYARVLDTGFSLAFFTFFYVLCRIMGSFTGDNHLTDIERLDLFFSHWQEHQDKIPTNLKPFFEKVYFVYKDSDGKILHNRQFVDDLYHALTRHFIQESLFLE